MISPLYRNRWLYRAVMRTLYRRHIHDRLRAVADLVPCGAGVLELCAGDCRLFLEHLRAKGVDYEAIDNAPALAAWARRKGVAARTADVRRTPLPHAQFVIMQASLYQFLPDARTLVDRMLDAASETVIIAEPVRNLATSRWRGVAAAARLFTKPYDGDDYRGERFDREALLAMMRDTGRVQTIADIPGGRELIVTLAGRATPT